MMIRIVFAGCWLLLILLAQGVSTGAEDIARLQAGVVKIAAKPPSGTANVGTGFIVRVDKDAAYIVTAAHVVAGGDQQPKVEFFTKRNLPVTAEVLGLEGDDEVRGLALLVVRGSENLPKGLTSLSLAGAVRLTGGEDILVIGFPRNAGPWAIVKGNISSRQGRDIYFSPSVESGHSGGPIVQGGKVVGVVGAGDQSVGRGVTVRSVQDYIEGFGITAQENVGSSSSAVSSAPAPLPPVADAKPAPPQPMQGREITGKDGAPMVLIPAGEFRMGSWDDDEYAYLNEKPAHSVYLNAFYIDQYEVTTTRYAKFFQETNREAPLPWSDQVLKQNGRKPVIGVAWNDAVAYCAWTGKRLPTEAEWEKAARGTDQRLYPWGNETPSEQRANFSRGYDFKNYEALTDVGSYEAGKSPYGVYDMAGNVAEWTADWYDPYYYGQSPPRNPTGFPIGSVRVIRGGSSHLGPDDVRSTRRGGNDLPTGRYSTVGFRCAQDIQ